MHGARLILPAVLVAALMTMPACGVRNARTDSVAIAQDLNQERFRGQPASIEAAEFLVEMANSRMANIEQSRLAVEETDTVSVRQFAERVVDEEEPMLERIRELASAKNIELPAAVSNKEAKELARLRKKNDARFDRKYIREMIHQHERDLIAFKQAAQSSDPAVRAFAQENLSTVEEHLSRIREIKRAY